SSQIAFTVVSLTVSLIAVLIPLLFMTDVVGRLFSEFAVTLAVTILISAAVSLSLVPMMCAQLLRRRPDHAAVAEHRHAEAEALLTDPDVESLTSFVGVDGTNPTLNSGRMQINLKPRSARTATASEIIRRLQRETAGLQGITLYMQPAQDLTIDSTVSRTQY